MTVFRPQSPAQKPTVEDTFAASLESRSDIIFTVPSFVEVRIDIRYDLNDDWMYGLARHGLIIRPMSSSWLKLTAL